MEVHLSGSSEWGAEEIEGDVTEAVGHGSASTDRLGRERTALGTERAEGPRGSSVEYGLRARKRCSCAARSKALPAEPRRRSAAFRESELPSEAVAGERTALGVRERPVGVESRSRDGGAGGRRAECGTAPGRLGARLGESSSGAGGERQSPTEPFSVNLMELDSRLWTGTNRQPGKIQSPQIKINPRNRKKTRTELTRERIRPRNRSRR